MQITVPWCYGLIGNMRMQEDVDLQVFVLPVVVNEGKFVGGFFGWFCFFGFFLRISGFKEYKRCLKTVLAPPSPASWLASDYQAAICPVGIKSHVWQE